MGVARDKYGFMAFGEEQCWQEVLNYRNKAGGAERKKKIITKGFGGFQVSFWHFAEPTKHGDAKLVIESGRRLAQ